jgi:ubiquinone/menaquinone biosynthesis C-methylase UbiE
MNDTFATKAAEWDNPQKVAMTKKFVDELLKNISPQPEWKALEIGAGTGLIGLQILPLVAKVVFEDTSEAMLNVLRQKLTGTENVVILHGEVFDYQKQDIDLIFSSMAFHHIEDLQKTVQHLSAIVKPGGLVVIADLVTEDGSFHSFEPIPHRGFDTAALSEIFTQAGFGVENVYVYNTISKLIDYDQFILIAQRK